MGEHLPHEFRYSLFMISGEDDLQCFSAVHCVHLESKNVESFVLAQLEVDELRNRNIRDDSAEVVQSLRRVDAEILFPPRSGQTRVR